MSDAEEVASGKQRPLPGENSGQNDAACPKNAAAPDLRSVEEFLSAISHDLKGPLSVIMVQAQLAQRDLQDVTLHEGSRLPDHLNGIVAMCQKMTALIEDLLDVTRRQMGQPVTLTLEPADLVALVQRVIARQPGRLESPLHFKPYPSQLLIQADVPRLERLVSNLVSNAMKVAAVDAPVVVTMDRVDNKSSHWAIVTIAISGPESLVSSWRTILERFAHLNAHGGAWDSLGLHWLGATQVMVQHNGVIDVVDTSGEASLVLRFPLIS